MYILSILQLLCTPASSGFAFLELQPGADNETLARCACPAGPSGASTSRALPENFTTRQTCHAQIVDYSELHTSCFLLRRSGSSTRAATCARFWLNSLFHFLRAANCEVTMILDGLAPNELGLRLETAITVCGRNCHPNMTRFAARPCASQIDRVFSPRVSAGGLGLGDRSDDVVVRFSAPILQTSVVGPMLIGS
jgi:hypothetical protein